MRSEKMINFKTSVFAEAEDYIDKLKEDGYVVVWFDEQSTQNRIIRVLKEGISKDIVISFDDLNFAHCNLLSARALNDNVTKELKRIKEFIDNAIRDEELKRKNLIDEPYWESLGRDNQLKVRKLQAEFEIYEREDVAYEFVKSGFSENMTRDTLTRRMLKNVTDGKEKYENKNN